MIRGHSPGGANACSVQTAVVRRPAVNIRQMPLQYDDTRAGPVKGRGWEATACKYGSPTTGLNGMLACGFELRYGRKRGRQY